MHSSWFDEALFLAFIGGMVFGAGLVFAYGEKFFRKNNNNHKNK